MSVIVVIDHDMARIGTGVNKIGNFTSIRGVHGVIGRQPIAEECREVYRGGQRGSIQFATLRAGICERPNRLDAALFPRRVASPPGRGAGIGTKSLFSPWLCTNA